MTHREDSTSKIMAVTDAEIGYTCKLKVYPGGSVAATACDKPIFHPPGWEMRPRRSTGREPSLLGCGEVCGPDREIFERESARAKVNTDRSRSRALTKLRDYALSNKFQYFVTLTLDKDRIDRYDYEAIVKGMRVWCDNQVRRKGLYYVLVPELHQDGALHFHGFFPEGVAVTDSGTIIPPGGSRPRKPRSKRQREEWLEGGGHLVYNLPDWKYGFSTAIPLYGTYHKAVAYVCKYIRKAPGKVGGRWYFSGGHLNTPDVQYTHETLEELVAEATDPETGETAARVYEVAEAGYKLAYTYTEVTHEYADGASEEADPAPAGENREDSVQTGNGREFECNQIHIDELFPGALDGTPGAEGVSRE